MGEHHFSYIRKLKKKTLGETVNFLCNPALIWRPTGEGLQNLANPVQNPYLFLAIFFKIFTKKKAFVLVAVPKLISHPKKTLLCTWKLDIKTEYSVWGGGGGGGGVLFYFLAK
jgi:hypothetical protein